MPDRTDRTRPRALLLAAALLAGLAVTTAHAADAPKKSANSLSLIPADVAFYGSTLRLKEQMDLFLHSKAYKALRALPTAKKAHAALMEKLKEKGGPLETYKKFTSDKQNKELVEVLASAVSHEVFFVGGKEWGDLLKLAQTLNNAQYFGYIGQLAGGAPPQQAQLRAILDALTKNKSLIKIPDLVIGFRLSEPGKGVAQVDRLEKILNGLEAIIAQLKDRIETKKDKNGKLILIKLDAGLIPWDMVDLSDFEKNKGEFDPLIAHLKKLKLTIALGIKGDNLLLSFGEGASLAGRLGAPGKMLDSLPELKPVLAAAGQKLVSIGYSSKALARDALGSNGDYTEVARDLKEALKNADIPEAEKKSLATDIDELVKDAKAGAIKPGAAVAYEVQTDFGYQLMGYSYGGHDAWKNVKFGLDKHFGGSPVFAAAFGCHTTGTHFKMFTKWARKFRSHGEAILLDKIGAEMADHYKKAMKVLDPFLKRLEDTTNNLLVPSLKDSGLGLVLDARWKSKQWTKLAPATPSAMPMAELGLLIGLSDAKKFQAAMKEYRLTLNELYAAGREASPNKDDLPEFQIPAAKSEKVGDASLFWWAIPEGMFDKQIQPMIGIGKTVSVMAASKAHAVRLLKATSLKPRDPALAITGKPLACCVLDWVGLIDLVSPWIEHGVASTMVAPADDADAAKKAKTEVAKLNAEIKQVLEIFKAFKGATCTTYLEGGVLVTKTVIVIRDLAGPSVTP